jgi:hypothetical protein
MTRDEIVKQMGWPPNANAAISDLVDRVEAVVRKAEEAEREACEQVCERRKSLYWMEFDKTGSDAERSAAIASEECATAIRARGESK